ncbi:DUF4832 domain-containing protein [Neptunicella marina]|uniref:DUF4832 domain-containing protein n=1 Tax=Neptunicella marina TaxID=2125989 RepID=A0A8J6IV26_9ALTE|nr:DUF4832 domain-containing protein [Neptunicella marina]MBC3766380.1 DUF4832 domain-containing protein [Neptunicella marina]
MMYQMIKQRALGITGLLLTTLALCSCQSSTSEPVSLQSSINSVQPMTGLVYWTDNPELETEKGSAARIEFSYLTYAEVVASNGDFDWQKVDNILTTAASRGHHVILRFHYTYPGVTTPSVPAFITNQAGYHMREEQVEGQPTFIPDWSSPALQDFTLAFLQAFAQRYNNDKRLMLVQLGFGSYAEYHLYEGPLTLGDTFPSKDFQQTFINTANSLFTRLQWAISIDSANTDYSPLQPFAADTALNFGLFDDSLMHQTHSENDQEYNRASWLALGENRYQNSIMGGELNYYSDWDQESALALPDGPWGKTFEWFAEQYHLTYVIANDQPEYQDVARLKQASMSLGYRFAITQFECDDSRCDITVTNQGTAPFYYDAFVCVNQNCAEQSLKMLQPGASLNLQLEGLTAPFKLSIESPRLLDGQTIQYEANI